MIGHYIKIAVRNLLKYKTQSILSILSLAVGLTCFTLATLWLKYEMTYDTSHINADRMYEFVYKNPEIRKNNINKDSIPNGGFLKEYAEIESVLSISTHKAVIRYKENRVSLPIIYTSPSIMDLFNIQVIQGNDEFIRYSIIEDEKPGFTPKYAINQAYAKKIFGDEEPIGKEFIFESSGAKGIIGAVTTGWGTHTNYPYGLCVGFKEFDTNPIILLKEKVNIQILQKKLKKRFPAFELIPLSKVHLKKSTGILLWDRDNDEKGLFNFQHIICFCFISCLIILCALVNYLSLFVNRLHTRQREFSLRRVSGASYFSIFDMLNCELLLTLSISTFLGLIFTELTLSHFLHYSTVDISKPEAIKHAIIYTIIALIFISLLAGVIIQYFSRISNKYYSRKRIQHKFSKICTVVQFIISFSFITATVILMTQLHYWKHTDLGIQLHNMGSLRITESNNEKVFTAQIRHKIEALPEIEYILPTCYPSLVAPGITLMRSMNPEENPNTSIELGLRLADKELCDFYGLTLATGRWFTENNTNEVVLSNELCKTFGWNPEEAIGQSINFFNRNYYVTGVMNTFYYEPPTDHQIPLAFYMDRYMLESLIHRASILFKFKEGTWQALKNKIEAIHREEYPFSDLYLYNEEEFFNDFFQSEDMLMKLFLITSLVCILLSVFGIYSLVTLSCEQRRKEIAIRKVNGAKTKDILKIFFYEYLLLLTIAALFTFPIIYSMYLHWIQSYTRHAEINICTFIFTYIGMVVLITVSIGRHIWITANHNPAEEVRKE